MLTSALELTLTGGGLLPCLMAMCRVVWNDLCPSGALLVVKVGLLWYGSGT